MNFSVIIPTKDRHFLLRRLLFGIDVAAKDYLGNIEVIVVDNASNKSVRKELKFFNPKNFRLTVLLEMKLGPSFARNKGLSAVVYDHVIFLDDDCEIESNFFCLYRSSWHKNPDAALIGGRTKVEKYDGELTSYEKYLTAKHSWLFGQISYESDKMLSIGESLFSANLSLNLKKIQTKKNFSEKVGVLDLKWGILFGEDFELCTRNILQGNIVYYTNSICVTNTVEQARFSIKYLLKRYLNKGIERAIYKLELIENTNKQSIKDRINELFGLRSLKFHSIFDIFDCIGYIMKNHELKIKKNKILFYHEKKHTGGGQTFVNSFKKIMGNRAEFKEGSFSKKEFLLLFFNKYSSIFLNVYSPQGAFLIVIFALLSKTPITILAYGFWHLESVSINSNQHFLKTFYYKTFQNFLFCLSKEIILLSKFQYTLFLKEFKNKSFIRKISVKSGSVDLEKFKSVKNKSKLRVELNLPKDRIIFLWAARLEKRKGLIVAINSFAKAQIKNKFLLIVFPVGDYSNIEILYDVFMVINKYNLYKDVSFTTAVDTQNIHQYYQAADIFLMSSIELETFGLTTIEALSSGCLVIGFKSGATTEILSKVDKILLADSISVSAYAKKMEQIVSLDRIYKSNLQLKSRIVASKYNINNQSIIT